MEAVRGHHISPLLVEKVADLMVVLLRREKGSVYVCTAAYVYTAAHSLWLVLPFLSLYYQFLIFSYPSTHMGFLFKLISTE